MKKTSIFWSLAFCVFASPLQAEWLDWRGPNGQGWVKEGELPMEFDAEGKGLAWKTELPGRGCSTPIVSEGLMFLTAPVDGNDALLAYDMEGKEKWRQSYGKQSPGRGTKLGSGANSSAACKGDTVVAYFKSGLVVACTRDGEKKWSKNLQKEYGKDHLWWDQGTSPIMLEKSVVVAVMQTEGNSYLVSLDLESGKEVWKTERKFKTAEESGDSYTTPHLMTIDEVLTIVSFGADHITGHDAQTGKQLWSSGGINPQRKGKWRTIASSVETEGIVVVPHGRGSYLMGLKAGGEGDITETSVLWRKKMANTDAATPIAKDGKILLLVDRGKERGKIIYMEAKTGKVIWEGKLPRSASTFYSSPLLVGDTLCCPREDGVVLMAKVTEKGLGEVKANKLGESFIASPVYVDGKLILRGRNYLWCLE